MTLESRTCEDCGSRFMVSELEIREAELAIPPNRHRPNECPEGLDQCCPSCYPECDGPLLCKKCRPKQDGQRA